jgi:transposase
VFEPTGSRRDAASVIFNLPGYRVIEAVDLSLGGRRVKVQPVDLDQGCPECGVVSSRVHAWVMQRVRDIGHAGRVEVVVRKPRLVCAEPACARRTFIAATDQLPLRARCTTRLRTALLAAVIDSGRAVAEVAADFRVAWWTVQATINAAAVLLPNIDQLYVRRLGIDEHRYRRVRWFRDETGGWRRVEPWMSTIVNADCGQVLGIVDGRDSASVAAWLATRSQAWRDRIEVVAIDPSAPFKKAIREQLPNALASVDGFHLVQLANLMVTRVRQRLIRDREDRRGRKIDPAWANRRLLLRGYDTLSPQARARLEVVFATDDPTDELSAAWGIKEQLRRLLKVQTVEQAPTPEDDLGLLPAGRRHGRELAAVGHHRGLVACHRSPHRAPGQQCSHRGSQHQHQTNQTHRPGISKSRPLPSPYPAHQRRPTRGVNPLTQQGTTVNCE